MLARTVFHKRVTSVELWRSQSSHIGSVREYHGDPGPRTSLHRKTARKQLRQAVDGGSGSIQGLDQLEKLFQLDSRVEGSNRVYSKHLPVGPGPSRSNDGVNDASRPPRQASQAKDVPSRSMISARQQNRLPRYSDGGSSSGLSVANNQYKTAIRIQKWIREHPSPIRDNEIENLILMITSAEKSQANVVAWNLLFGLLGREGKLNRMWKAFNEMKKRGINPDIYTYSGLLNAYAENALSSTTGEVVMKQPEATTLSRVTNIFDQSQAYLRQIKGKSTVATSPLTEKMAENDIGLNTSSVIDTGFTSTLPPADTTPSIELISVVAINSYLKYLAKYAMTDEMQRIFISMERTGPLAPDNVTYTTMFTGLLNRQKQHDLAKKAGTASTETMMSISSTARSLWDQAVRQFGRQSTGSPQLAKAGIDEGLAVIALQTLVNCRHQDKRLAIDLIPQLWGLSTPGRSTSIPNSEESETDKKGSSDLPLLPVTISAATSILNILRIADQPTLATHLTQSFLNNLELQQKFDFPFLRSAISTLALTGDVSTILSIMETYQPQTVSGQWPPDVWLSALRAARFSADFPVALNLFRRLTYLPPNIEKGHSVSKPGSASVEWSPPNDQRTDIQGNKWIPTKPVKPYATIMTMFLKVARNADKSACKQALSIFTHYPLKDFFDINEKGITMLPPFKEISLNREVIRGIQARLSLAREVEGVCEVLRGMGGDREREWRGLGGVMKGVHEFWGSVLNKVERGQRGGVVSMVESRDTDLASTDEVDHAVGGEATEKGFTPVVGDRPRFGERERRREKDDRTYSPRLSSRSSAQTHRKPRDANWPETGYKARPQYQNASTS